MSKQTRAPRQTWRYFTGIKSIILLVIFIVGLFLHLFTQKIITGLRTEARGLVTFYARMYARVAETESTEDFSFLFDEIVLKTNFPLINTDSEKNPLWWKGIDIDPDDRSTESLEKVLKLVRKLDREIEPVPIKYQNIVLGYLYYSDSHLIEQLYWMPYIEIGIVGIFLLVGFIGFANLQRSEQRFIWVGMAKETAHQLGTPLSSLMGWLELLQQGGKVDKLNVYKEMERDLVRLNQVSKRFSQIGSRPDLKLMSIKPVIEDVADYMRIRVPSVGRKVLIEGDYRSDGQALLNRDLFRWGLENILKNSLDAMDKQEGKIIVKLFESTDKIIIEIDDNGRGMDKKLKKRVFKPGFSTKKRGWGLGLNLSRRIIEEYHSGKVWVLSSRSGQGTTMRIELRTPKPQVG